MKVFTPTAFNSPLESGIRSTAILHSSYPDAFDLERLVEMDYIVVHSGDAGGPESLHAPLPMRAGELLVRRQIVERGLLLMASRGFVERIINTDGFYYVAGENAEPFLSSLISDYSRQLLHRATWATETFRGTSTEDIRKTTERLFDTWSSQFMHPQE